MAIIGDGFEPGSFPFSEPKAVPAGYELFQSKVKELIGIDLSHYKEQQMTRRLTGYLSRVGEADFFALARRIESDETRLDHLRNFMMIHVSEFFRNPDRFEVLSRDVLPELRQRFGGLKLWSAGTSTGSEAYSLAILLHEMGLRAGDQVLATDVDGRALEEAKAGLYGEEMLKEVSPERRERYFRPVSDGKWEVVPQIKALVRFDVHDLLKDPYPQDMHLVLCRNVLIYFTDPAKDMVYEELSQALKPGGYLLVGSTESIFSARQFCLETANLFLYRRQADKSA